MSYLSRLNQASHNIIQPITRQGPAGFLSSTFNLMNEQQLYFLDFIEQSKPSENKFSTPPPVTFSKLTTFGLNITLQEAEKY